MPPADILQAIHTRPFQPFRIYRSDGAVYDVRHPELVMVGIASAVIGAPASGQTSHERYQIVDLCQIQRVAPIPPARKAS